jgi:damage-control phosphatase, subfamily I
MSGPIFFLLQAKCSVIADDLGVQPGAIILKGPAY